MAICLLKFFTLSITGCFLLASCSNSTSFSNDGVEQRPVSQGHVDTLDATVKDDSPIIVFRGHYKMTVTAKDDGLEICAGEFDASLWSSQYFEPSGVISCMLKGDISLAESFPKSTSKAFPEFPEYGMIVRIENRTEPGEPIFEPERMAGPVTVQDHREFQNYRYTETNQVTVLSEEEGLLSDTGTFTVQVEEIELQRKIPSGEFFPNVISYSVTTDGFDNIPGHLIDRESRRQTWLNTYPIALIEVNVESSLPDKLPGLTSTIGDLIFGPIIINIKLLRSLPVQ